MITDLKYYVSLYAYKGVVSNEICDQTVKEMDSIEFQEHTFYNANTNEYKPRSAHKNYL